MSDNAGIVDMLPSLSLADDREEIPAWSVLTSDPFLPILLGSFREIAEKLSETPFRHSIALRNETDEEPVQFT
jgi:hypothetical protein